MTCLFWCFVSEDARSCRRFHLYNQWSSRAVTYHIISSTGCVRIKPQKSSNSLLEAPSLGPRQKSGFADHIVARSAHLPRGQHPVAWPVRYICNNKLGITFWPNLVMEIHCLCKSDPATEAVFHCHVPSAFEGRNVSIWSGSI